jgi:DNA replication protein DnaC
LRRGEHGRAEEEQRSDPQQRRRTFPSDLNSAPGATRFLQAKDNVVLLGPPGTGKTHLAIALAIRACLSGQRVLFATETEWVARLADGQRQGRLAEELAFTRSPRGVARPD